VPVEVFVVISLAVTLLLLVLAVFSIREDLNRRKAQLAAPAEVTSEQRESPSIKSEPLVEVVDDSKPIDKSGPGKELLRFWKERSRAQKVLSIGFVFLVLAGVAYWLSGSEKRRAHDALEKLQIWVRNSQFESSTVIQLQNGNWAKWTAKGTNVHWDFQPTGNDALPFQAIITNDLENWATVYHSLKSAAEVDERFYRFNGKSFFERPERYAIYSSLKPTKWRRRLLFNGVTDYWVSQGVEEEEP
jgi:hypothetical protein